MKRLKLSPHGGACCGVVHLYGFVHYSTGDLEHRDLVQKETEKDIQDAIKIYTQKKGSERENMSCVIEVTLKQSQLEHDGGFYAKLMEKYNFKLGPVWKNQNSTNFVYMFHHYIDRTADAPFLSKDK